LAIEKQLREWRERLEEELVELNDDYKEIELKLTKTRQQIEAIDRLLSDQSTAVNPETQKIHRSNAVQSFTRLDLYWPAILESLIELGGAARSEKVIDRVGQKLEHILTASDREILRSGIDIRWRNRTAWQRYHMVRQGLLKSNSPRGVWEITEEGRRWLEIRSSQNSTR